MARTRVLIVDDSALMRQLLTEIISRDPALEVVGVAQDPYGAIDKIKRLNPDVLTLDVEMPRMDGLTFLEKLMRAHPMPVLMVSSLTEQGCRTTLRALELGAIDFVTKPHIDVAEGIVDIGDEIVAKLKICARCRPRVRAAAPATPAARQSVRPMARTTNTVVAIGASTGGTDALRVLLAALPPDAPGIAIVQHMPQHFTKAFAERLDTLCQVRVKEAEHGDRILPGTAVIAPGNRHMRIVRSGASYLVTIEDSAPFNHHRPSVDHLFDSVARHAGSNAVGVILTGMGADGAKGLMAMRQAGARTIAQDEASCVVFGMPKEAIALGAAEQVLTLEAIPAAVLRLVALAA